MRLIACAVFAFAAACGNAPDCQTAVEKAMAATHPKDTEFVVGAVKMCEKDGWSGEVRKCLAAVKSDADAEACLSKVDSLSSEVARRRLEAEEARKRAVDAAEAAAKAAADAKAAYDRVNDVQKDVDALNGQIAGAVDAVANAKNAADRDRAKAALEALQKQKQDLEQRMTVLKGDAARAERTKGVHVSKECLDNPLAKGCS